MNNIISNYIIPKILSLFLTLGVLQAILHALCFPIDYIAFYESWNNFALNYEKLKDLSSKFFIWCKHRVLRYFQVKDRNHLGLPSLVCGWIFASLISRDISYSKTKISLKCPAKSMAVPQLAYFSCLTHWTVISKQHLNTHRNLPLVTAFTRSHLFFIFSLFLSLFSALICTFWEYFILSN